jgi:2'-5' RNA ligase superfamily
MRTAVAIVPPEHLWDSLQRARHLAHDATYTTWPPCLRLLHPFTAATDVGAQSMAEQIDLIIKENQNVAAVQPFSVTLDQWMVIPHIELLEDEWYQPAETTEAQETNRYWDVIAGGYAEGSEQRREVEALIAQVEMNGKAKLRERQEKRAAKGKVELNDTLESSSLAPDTANDTSTTASLRERLDEQKRMYQEFNGPCVICLEPNYKSATRLKQLRQALLQHDFLRHFAPYSPTSSVTDPEHGLPRSVLQAAPHDEDDYRPVLPIAKFATVSEAVAMAKRLRRLWKPLTFEVTELHVLSCLPQEPDDDDTNGDMGPPASLHSATGASFRANQWKGLADEEKKIVSSNQYGCDAAVMLAGEELPMDPEVNAQMAKMVLEQGEAGGGDLASLSSTISRSLAGSNDVEQPVDNDDMDDLLSWLDDDDDFNSGTVVVIGRTHFFTGEMRQYDSMPATSVVDARDRAAGSGAWVSADARRRGSPVGEPSNTYSEGEWGHRKRDHLPRPKRNPRKK